MDIETSNAIKLFFPSPSLLQVFFEALANSLDAGASEISVDIRIHSFIKPETLEIKITDNGKGFTNESFERFRRLLKAQDSFHKGLGRLVFLHYFSDIRVDSVYDEQDVADTSQRRTFVFNNLFDGGSKVENLTDKRPRSTTLYFTKFIRERVKSYDDLRPGALKARIIEQFLPTLQMYRRIDQNIAIKISLVTTESNSEKDFFSSDEIITTADLPDLISVSIKDPSLDAYEGIEMCYQIKSGMGERTFLIAASIDGRTIPINLLSQNSIPSNHSVLILFFSKLFDGKADSSRQSLVLPDNISEADLTRVLRREVGKVLSEKIPIISNRNATTRIQFEECFPHLVGLFEETTVGLINYDEALEIAQSKFFRAQKDVMQCKQMDDATFEKSLELSSRTLTEYVLYRAKIIAKMREITKENSEAEIHNLIVPRWNQFHKNKLIDGIYRNNAWLLDDKFMSFQTILSESRMDDIVEAITLKDSAFVDEGRPDVTMIFSADPEIATVDVVVVEIKRKSEDEKDSLYAINQLLDRAVKLATHCPNIQRIWYYAVININDTIATRLRQMKWAPLFSNGKVFYQEFQTERPNKSIVPTPTFVLSFDAIVADAECRNKTFLEILRNGIKKHAEEQLTPPEAIDEVETQLNETENGKI